MFVYSTTGPGSFIHSVVPSVPGPVVLVYDAPGEELLVPGRRVVHGVVVADGQLGVGVDGARRDHGGHGAEARVAEQGEAGVRIEAVVRLVGQGSLGSECRCWNDFITRHKVSERSYNT